MASQHQLRTAFDDLLQPARIKDYGPNGLQVEGKPEVALIVSGVTASTERYGAPAVAAHVAAQCGVGHQFIDIDNPA